MITLTKDKYWTEPEQAELKRVLKLIGNSNLRDVLLVEMCLYSGARIGEIIKIENSDLDQAKESVFIRHPEKGSSPREVPLNHEFFSRVFEFGFSNSDSKLLFPITTSRARHIWRLIRPYPKSIHTLRHTFARNVREILKRKRKDKNQDMSLKDLEIIQYLLGHKSITSTMIYAREELEVDQLRGRLGL